MSLPIGSWEMNSHGYEGTLAITSVDAQGNVAGTLKLGSTYNITGTWDETKKKLSFSYQVPGKFGSVTGITYVGYFFLGGSPLFKYNPPAGGYASGECRLPELIRA